jgi:hypothetical protein
VNSKVFRFSLRALLVVMTVAAVVIAVTSNYPMAVVLVVGISSTLAFLTLSAFFAGLAGLGFLRFWHSYDITNESENASANDAAQSHLASASGPHSESQPALPQASSPASR